VTTPPGWLRAGLPHLWLPYTQMGIEAPPIAVAATDGTRIILEDDRALVDGMASWWTACHGYNHPHITAALKAQAEKMPHVMIGGLAHQGAVDLARRLAALAPGDLSRVFFSDSGSTAVEVALKLVLQCRINRGEEGRHKFLCFKGGYHGDTFAAMSVSDDAGFARTFAPMLPEQIVSDLPSGPEGREAYGRLLDAHRHELAGVIFEPSVQGAGGMLFHDTETIRAVVTDAQARGLLVIADEIFAGFHRTGPLFACAEAGAQPDILCLGKALTGGALGMGATLATTDIFESFLGDDLGKAFMHGPTFMANPLACAAANASLDLFEQEPRAAQAHAIEAALLEGLAPARALAGVADVRARGAIGVVELNDLPFDRLTRLRAAFIEAGLWVRPFGRIVYLTPALSMTRDDLDRLTAGICKVLAAVP
jgi:adenosylmethionine---8-amino-7-oxononanoate aminotransferase